MHEKAWLDSWLAFLFFVRCYNRLRYDELEKSLDAFTASSVDNLLDKIRLMASRPIPEFNKFESLDLLEALKNAAQDTKHEKAGYYKFVFETLRGKINEPNEQLRNFLLPLLRDKDQEKVLEVVAKLDKKNRRRQTRQNPGGERKARAVPYSGGRCFYCNRFGHVQAYCFKRKMEMTGPSGFSCKGQFSQSGQNK